MSVWRAEAMPLSCLPCDSMISTGRPARRTRKWPGEPRQPRDPRRREVRYPAGAPAPERFAGSAARRPRRAGPPARAPPASPRQLGGGLVGRILHTRKPLNEIAPSALLRHSDRDKKSELTPRRADGSSAINLLAEHAKPARHQDRGPGEEGALLGSTAPGTVQ